MKRLMLFAAMAAMMMAQDAAKVPAPKDGSPGNPSFSPVPLVPSERLLAEGEYLSMQLDAERVKNIQAKYHIEDYQKEIQPVFDHQRATAVAACKSIGIPDEKMQAECQLNIGGNSSDGKPLLGADGKPVQPKVWRQAPTSPVAQPPAK